MKNLFSLLLLLTLLELPLLAQVPARVPRTNTAPASASAPATNAAPAFRPLPPRPTPSGFPPASTTAPAIPRPTPVAPAPAQVSAPAGAATAPGVPPATTGVGRDRLTVPGSASAGGALGSTNFMRNLSTNAAGEIVVKSGQIKFQAAPLDQVLDVYAELVGRTVLRPASLPAAQITLKTQNELTLKEAKEALDSVLSLNGITTILVGEKFITIVPTAQAQQEAAAFNNDTNAVNNLPEAGQYTTRVVQLRAAKPSEIVPALQAFSKVQNGILPIDANNILILRDNAANIKRMLELIEKIDVIIPLEEELKVIPIRFALASDISSVLSSLTSGGVSSTGTGARSSSSRGGRSGASGRSTGGFGTSTTGFGTPGSYPGGVNGVNPGGINQPAGINVNPGNSASSFADRLRQSIQGAIKPNGGAGPLLGDAKIIADERTNSLLVFGNTNDIAQVEKVVGQLDLVQAQVLIEAIIMEVSLDDTKKVGVSSAQLPEKKLFGPIRGFGGNNNSTFFSTTNLVTSPNDLPSGGLSYFAKLGPSWNVALQAIASDGSVNVLSRPRIQTFHATEATLFVGDTIPYVTGTISDINGGARSQYQQTQVGITLTVLPLVNPDGLVVMDIQQNIEQLGTNLKIDGNDVPTTTKRQAQAKVAVMDGDSVILGGFISSTKQSSKSGVPYLKDIPYLGALFRSKTDSNKRTELIVLMRPTVLKTPQISAIVAEEERGKLAGVKRAELQIQEEERLLKEKNEAIVKRMKEKANSQ